MTKMEESRGSPSDPVVRNTVRKCTSSMLKTRQIGSQGRESACWYAVEESSRV